ncbi:hypothetical protein BJ741DRAFT_629086 [Chytriomyces cf. hyalinus JEL632]|nr:hypothetical protein BJ741DRAFT_629086 [Chytriomyces cf. hyalinus JEL632]
MLPIYSFLCLLAISANALPTPQDSTVQIQVLDQQATYPGAAAPAQEVQILSGPIVQVQQPVPVIQAATPAVAVPQQQVQGSPSTGNTVVGLVSKPASPIRQPVVVPVAAGDGPSVYQNVGPGPGSSNTPTRPAVPGAPAANSKVVAAKVAAGAPAAPAAADPLGGLLGGAGGLLGGAGGVGGLLGGGSDAGAGGNPLAGAAGGLGGLALGLENGVSGLLQTVAGGYQSVIKSIPLVGGNRR